MVARQLPLLRPALLLLGAELVAVAGCSSSSSTDVAVTHPTMIEVSPENFLGDVPCVRGDGVGLKRYVATLIDINEALGSGAGGAADAAAAAADGRETVRFQLPSSVATSCLAAVGFGFVVPGRLYTVEIDGYDTDDLSARALGSREQVTGDDRLAVPSRSTACKRAIAVDSTIVRADDCDPFPSADPEADGGLRIELAPLLGALRCGSAEGEVAQLSVSLSVPGEAEPRVQTVACSEDASAVFDDLPSRQLLSARVTALGADGSAELAGSSCTARTAPATTVDAQCSPLNRVATVRIDLKAALGQLGLSCTTADVSALKVNVPGEERVQVVTPPSCLQPFEQGFPPGPAALTVTVLQGDEQVGSLTCHAEAAPGRLVVAQCEPNPAE